MIIRVLLADDHSLVRAGIRSLLGAMAEVQVVGEASSGEEALELAGREQPDVVLMDIAMKGITGLEAAARMRERHPSVRVVILSMHSGEEYVLRWAPGGVLETVAKGTPKPPIADKNFAGAVFGIWLGDHAIQDDIKRDLVSRSHLVAK